jgi:hypothetical protein
VDVVSIDLVHHPVCIRHGGSGSIAFFSVQVEDVRNLTQRFVVGQDRTPLGQTRHIQPFWFWNGWQVVVIGGGRLRSDVR